jgi:DNA-directed RNA polymerase subunit H (RpoH/RPB5)
VKKKDRSHYKKEINKRQHLKKIKSLILIIFILAIEVFYLGWVIFDEMNKPTMHFNSISLLHSYIKNYGNSYLKTEILNETENQNIYIWPTDRTKINLEAELDKEILTIFKNTYPEEFNLISAKEMNLLSNYTVREIENDIVFRFKNNLILKIEEIKEINSIYSNEEFSKILKFFSYTRYKWLGYNKTLIYFVYFNEENLEIKFVSFSDIAEKYSVFKRLSFPFGLLFLTTFIWFIINILSNNYQKKIFTLENKILQSNSIFELCNKIYNDISIIDKNLTSFSIQILNGQDFFLYKINEKDNCKNYYNRVDNDSYTVKRRIALKDEYIDYFESFSDSNKIKIHSITIPVRVGGEIYSFINFNFSNFMYSEFRIYLINQISQPLINTFLYIDSIYSDIAREELSIFTAWIRENRQKSPTEFFYYLSEKFLNEKSNLKLLNNLYDINILKTDELLNEITTKEFEILNESNYFIFIKDHHLYYYYKIKLGDTYSYIKIIFIHTNDELNPKMPDFIKSIFQQFSNQILEFSETYLKEIIMSEMIKQSTGFQDEAKEILDQKYNNFTETIDFGSIFDQVTIQMRVSNWIKEHVNFNTQGFGALFEIDLSKSSLIKQKINLDLSHDYEHTILKHNEKFFELVQNNLNKFLISEKSGGDGDGIRFFLTSRNIRKINHNTVPPYTLIDNDEKEYYRKKIFNSILDMLEYSHICSTPWKIGVFLLDSNSEMSLKLERGIIKINSYLDGLLDHSRSIKNFRFDNKHSQINTITLDFSSTKPSFIETPLPIYLPWTAILPEEFEQLLLEHSNKIQYREFYIERFNSGINMIKKYYEIRLIGPYRKYYHFYPFLSILPLKWTIEFTEFLLMNLINFFKEYNHQKFDLKLIEFYKLQILDPKYKSFQIDLELKDLQNLLIPINHEIESNGLYFPIKELDSKRLGDYRKNEYLHLIYNKKIPILKTMIHNGEKLNQLKNEYYQNNNQNEKKEILKQMNIVFESQLPHL